MTKVECIKDDITFLTYGNVYQVEETIKNSRYGEQYKICDDNGHGVFVHHSHFKPVDEPKDKTVKIKAKFDCHFGDYKVGDVFEAQETPLSYVFKGNSGDKRLRHKSEFDVVPDEPAIDVGSVWVNEHGDEVGIKYSSDLTVVYGDDEECSTVECFRAHHKPKPKTVTMYFYKIDSGYMAREEAIVGVKHLFTREIELP